MPSALQDLRRAATPIAVFALLWFLAALPSDGFVAADGYTHYLYARFAFTHPANFTDVWARPLCTAFYAIPALIGARLGVCAASLLAAIGCGIVADRMARDQRDRLPRLALICTLGQPLLFLHTLTAMTELPFALLLGLCFLAFSKKRYALSALLASLLPLARPEGFGLVAVMALALLWRKKVAWIFLLPVPLLLWSMAGWDLDGRQGIWWQWLQTQWPYSSVSLYGRGNPLQLLAALPIVVSPLLLPATLLGSYQSLFSRPVQTPNEVRWTRMAATLLPLGVLTIHTLLHALGRMGSYGEPRYLLIASPFWGVLAARGWTWAFDRLRWNHPIRWASLAVLAPVVLNLVHPVVPLRFEPDWLAAGKFAHWYQTPSVRGRFPRLLCAHPGILYGLDLSPADHSTLLPWDRSTILSKPPHSLLVWDPIYSPRNATARRAVTLQDLTQSGWTEVPDLETEALGDSARSSIDWHLFVTEH